MSVMVDTEAHVASKTKPRAGLSISRKYTVEGVDPFSLCKYDVRTSRITNTKGDVVFEAREVEVPTSWSQLATDILASKYFRKRGVSSGGGGETSVKQVISRIVNTIGQHGFENGYFDSETSRKAFCDELTYMLLHQYGAFNSPVFFNCGLYHAYGIKGSNGTYRYNPTTRQVESVPHAYMYPQISACFIQGVEDDLMDIFDLVKNEAKLFKYGSGTGASFDRIRGKGEPLSGGGSSSGLLSWLKVLDTGAGSIKSGGTSRRAATMRTLSMDHPDIVDFIEWKQKEEAKAKALIAQGYPADYEGEAYATVSGQNSNNSVRVSDDFMYAVEHDDEWSTIYRTNGKVAHTYKAKELWNKIAKAAWQCADPGVQYDTTINAWHTVPNAGPIRSSNPCSEFLHHDHTACNLASLNLTKFLRDVGTGTSEFDVDGFRHAVRIFFTAQEILVGLSSYPTEKIAENSYKFRPLGLGYCNLGTLLMTLGLPYDSDEGRAVASCVTAIMHCHAGRVSAGIASELGSFEGFDANQEPMQAVMQAHRAAAFDIPAEGAPDYLRAAAIEDAVNMVSLGEKYGYRNSQFTVLAPTGTIGLLMDCDTTGVEPDFALVKYKKLAGGGNITIVNASVRKALGRLGYTLAQIDEILAYALGTDSQKGHSTLEGAPYLKEEHLAVFDCASRCGDGTRYIAPNAHLKMMAAVQPFLSGSISKTVNVPNDATVEQIQDLYYQGWKLGLKCVAVYRDGCKASQPLSTKAELPESGAVPPAEMTLEQAVSLVDTLRAKFGAALFPEPEPYRRRLPKRRHGMTQEATISGTKLFLRTGEYEDGTVGEIFLDMHKEGAAFRAMANAFAISVSMGLQYGVPLDAFVEQFTFTRFEPHGPVQGDEHIKNSTSILDYVFRTIGVNYLQRDDLAHVKPDRSTASRASMPPIVRVTVAALATDPPTESLVQSPVTKSGAPFCDYCGHLTVRNGTCWRCLGCGSSLGCS